MADVYKIIHPVNYFDEFITRKVRPDGRSFKKIRDIKISAKAIKTADASAIIKVGNTTVVCGIKLELAKPKAEEPNLGFLVTNVELPAMCSPKLRPGPPSDFAQVTSSLLSDMLKDSECVDLKELCIAAGKLVWVLQCDIMCFNNDGSVLDACLIALIASLKTLTLPHVQLDEETSEITVDDTKRKPFNTNGIPVATSFAVYNNIVLIDPSAYEEEMCCDNGANLVVCHVGDMLCGVHKFASTMALSDENYSLCMELAREKTTVVENLIKCAIKESIK